MDGLWEGYEFFARHAGISYVNESYRDWDQWIRSVEKEIEAFSEHMGAFEGYGTDISKLAGDVAEFWHADTFNIHAALNKSSCPRAEVPRSNIYGSKDVALGENSYQLKYYKDADSSVIAQSKTFGQDAHRGSGSAQALIDAKHVGENDPVYGDMQRLVPSDQLEDARIAASKRFATESARRPEQAQRYKKTLDNLTDRVDDGNGTSSIGLTREGANELAREAKAGEVDLRKWGLTTDQLIALEEIVNQSLRAGLSVAAISAVLEVAPVVIEAVRHLITEGEFDDIALSRGASAAVTGGAEGFLVGTVTASITYGARAGFMGPTIKKLDPGVVGTIAVMSISVLTNAVRTATGGMTTTELASSIGRDTLIATCSMIGRGISDAAIHIPVFGYLLGSLVGSAVGGLAWSIAEKTTVALCVERGLTLFGIVGQDYELPEEVLRQIGIEPFEADALVPDTFEPDRFEPSVFEAARFESEPIGIRQLRRGVVGIGKVGYDVC